MLKATSLRTLQRIAEGLCTVCAAPVEGDIYRRATGQKMRMCRECRKKEAKDQKKLRADRLAKGLCVRCGKSAARKNLQMCGWCQKGCTLRVRQRNKKTFFDRKARNGSNNSHYSVLHAKTLWSIWKEQRGRCALTGVRLTRDNCELDHITPISKGGGHERANLRWLQKDVNQAKRALSDVEFLELCKSVIAYAEKVNGAI
jgi:hypothetical protein